jgi:hypothetical protein
MTLARSYPVPTTEKKSIGLMNYLMVRLFNFLNKRFSSRGRMFNPKLVNSDAMSLIEIMRDSLGRCDAELASEMKKNIVVCGGTSIIKGL